MNWLQIKLDAELLLEDVESILFEVKYTIDEDGFNFEDSSILEVNGISFSKKDTLSQNILDYISGDKLETLCYEHNESEKKDLEEWKASLQADDLGRR